MALDPSQLPDDVSALKADKRTRDLDAEIESLKLIIAKVHSNHQLISSEDVEGTNVHDIDGKKVGEIDHLMIDKISGRVTHAVMSFGGLLGVAHRHYSLPWSCSSPSLVRGTSRTNQSCRCVGRSALAATLEPARRLRNARQL